MAAPEDDSLHGLPHPLAARSTRRGVANVLTAVALVGLAVSVWPTERRKLEKRVMGYLEATNRGDWAAAYAYLSPAGRERVSLKAWSPANTAERARRELVSVKVDDGGKTAIVTLVDAKSRANMATSWIRVGWDWYLDSPSR